LSKTSDGVLKRPHDRGR